MTPISTSMKILETHPLELSQNSEEGENSSGLVA